MCGIAGYLTRGRDRPRVDRIEALFRSIRRRGPDDAGICLVDRRRRTVRSYCTDDSVPEIQADLAHVRQEEPGFLHDLALLHTRYAVIDPTPGGHQPFVADEGRLAVAFHGEVFNYRELREELEAHGARFRSSSDTEVLALAYRAWGNEAWSRLNGFWAAAVYDGRTGRLVLSRDRVGIAPLYAADTSFGLLFGTSVLDLGRFVEVGPRVHRGRVKDFLETGLKDFGSETLFDGVRALSPGTCLVVEAGNHRLAEATPWTYWSLPSERIPERALSIDEAAGRLRETLADALRLRLRSDLPLAFQLSGGLDSSSVVALAAQMRQGPLATYTVSVPEDDEEPLTRSMERRFDLSRRVLRGCEQGFAADAVAFARLMEEPIQAPAAYGHHRLCREMRGDGFGVALSGSGGDEVLAGYQWDFWPAARADLFARRRVVHALRHQAALRYGTFERATESIRGWLRWVRSLPARALAVLKREASDASGQRSSAPADRPSPEDAGAAELLASYWNLDYEARRRFHFRVADLPYYLVSNDRATLGIPIEHRQPFLDHRLVELGFRMPVEHLFKDGWTKYVLRRAMAPMLPDEIVWRREKSGFPFPVRRLLRSGRPWLEPHLDRVRREGFLHESDRGYSGMLDEEPLRLWRFCSTGLWLHCLDGDHHSGVGRTSRLD